MLFIIIVIVLLIIGSNKRKQLGRNATGYFTVACVISTIIVMMEIANYIRSLVNTTQSTLSGDMKTNVMVAVTLAIIAEIGLMVACYKMRKATMAMPVPKQTKKSDKDDEEIDIFKDSKPEEEAADEGAKTVSAFIAEQSEEESSEELDYDKIASEIYDVSKKLEKDLADALASETGLSIKNEKVAGPARGYAKMFYNLGAITLSERIDEIDGDVDELAKSFAKKRKDVTIATMKKYTELPKSDVRELRETFEKMDDETNIPAKEYLQEVEEIIDKYITQDL